MGKVIDFIYQYLSSKGEVPGGAIEEKIKQDYFDAGVIDSFGVIEFIVELENKYDIKFSPKDLQDNRFRTIEGLAQIIREKSNK